VKTVATAVLLITLAGCPVLSFADNGDSPPALPAASPPASSPDPSSVSPVELTNNLSPLGDKVTPIVASPQDLSIFGVISLGIIGLFWIRRHTSEL
jgi:hypothetical protein